MPWPAYQDWQRLRPLDADVHNALGLIFTRKKLLEEAAAEFEQAIGLEPGKAVFRNNLGAAWADMGRPAEAIAHFDAAVDLRPDYAEAHKNRGMNLLQLGNFEDGWLDYEWRWRVRGFSTAVVYAARLGGRFPGRQADSALHGAGCRGHDSIRSLCDRCWRSAGRR